MALESNLYRLSKSADDDECEFFISEYFENQKCKFLDPDDDDYWWVLITLRTHYKSGSVQTECDKFDARDFKSGKKEFYSGYDFSCENIETGDVHHRTLLSGWKGFFTEQYHSVHTDHLGDTGEHMDDSGELMEEGEELTELFDDYINDGFEEHSEDPRAWLIAEGFTPAVNELSEEKMDNEVQINKASDAVRVDGVQDDLPSQEIQDEVNEDIDTVLNLDDDSFDDLMKGLDEPFDLSGDENKK
jgi:hypothetical protein